MACILWKNGEKTIVKEAKRVPSMLKRGYSGSREASLTAAPSEPKQTEPGAATETEGSVRERAKSAGIKNWHNKKITTLLKELENVNQG